MARARKARDRRPSLAVWKFASCDGCQLSLLDCEDELLAVAGLVRIASFPEATRAWTPGPYDISLVEGSITTPEDAARIQEVRAQSRLLVTIGACATSGGIQALRNAADVAEYRSVVYAHPAYVETLARSTPVSDHVTVDLALPGCPVDRGELLEVLAALVHGRKPRLRQEPVCTDCRRAGQVCVLVADGEPCLGPVTRGGCHALCPTVGRGCFGCFGPAPGADVASLGDRLVALTGSRDQVRRLFATVTAGAEPFRREAERQSVLAAAEEGA